MTFLYVNLFDNFLDKITHNISFLLYQKYILTFETVFC